MDYINESGVYIKSIIERDKEIYDERNNESKSKDYQNIIEKDEKVDDEDYKEDYQNRIYINVKGSHYTDSPWLITRNRTPPHHFVDGKITSKTIGKTILPTSCQNYAAPCVTKTIGKIIWLREMLMLKGKVKVVPSKNVNTSKAKVN